jgi:hypothetical protein
MFAAIDQKGTSISADIVLHCGDRGVHQAHDRVPDLAGPVPGVVLRDQGPQEGGLLEDIGDVVGLFGRQDEPAPALVDWQQSRAGRIGV